MSISPLSTAKVETQSEPKAVKARRASSLVVAALGLIVLYGAGFAEISSLHNATHDGRHSAGFPCH